MSFASRIFGPAAAALTLLIGNPEAIPAQAAPVLNADDLPDLTSAELLNALEGQIGDIRYRFGDDTEWRYANHPEFNTPTWSKLDHRCVLGVKLYVETVLEEALKLNAEKISFEMVNSIYDDESGADLPPPFTERRFDVPIGDGTSNDYDALTAAITDNMHELLELEGRYQKGRGEHVKGSDLGGHYEHRFECIVG